MSAGPAIYGPIPPGGYYQVTKFTLAQAIMELAAEMEGRGLGDHIGEIVAGDPVFDKKHGWLRPVRWQMSDARR